MIQTSYSEARERLASLMDKATEDRETVIIKRRGHPDVALIAADELAGLEETAHLLRSPANAVRLFEGLAQAARGEGMVVDLHRLQTLRRAIEGGATYDEALARAGITEPRLEEAGEAGEPGEPGQPRQPGERGRAGGA
jgi:antitoxin YefM